MPNAKEQLYDENRFLMNKTEAGFRKLLIAYIVLSAIFLSLGLWLTVPTANSPEARGPEQFYLIFGIGFGEVLMAVLTFVLGYFTVMKKTLPLILQYILFGAMLIYAILLLHGMTSGFNIAMSLAGFGVAAWATKLQSTYRYLEEQEGFPLFSLRADTPAEYVPPLNVRMTLRNGDLSAISARMKNAMEDLPTPQNPLSEQPKAAMPSAELPTVQTEERPKTENTVSQTESFLFGESKMSSFFDTPASELLKGNLPPMRSSNEPITPAPPTVPAEPPRPTVSAESMLSDMTPETAHRTVKGELPDPAEVRARMMQMKKERDAAAGMQQQ